MVWLHDLSLQHHFALNNNVSWAWEMERRRTGRLEKWIEDRWRRRKKDKGGNRATGGRQGVVIFQEHGMMGINTRETDALQMLTV